MDEIDQVFDSIITRNFKQCKVDNRYYIFQHNQEDEKVDLRDQNAN